MKTKTVLTVNQRDSDLFRQKKESDLPTSTEVETGYE